MLVLSLLALNVSGPKEKRKDFEVKHQDQEEQELSVSMPSNYKVPWFGRHFLGVMLILLLATFAFAIVAFVVS